MPATIVPPPVSLPALHPFSGMDLWMLVQQKAQTHADHPFLIWRPFDGTARRQWTYAEFAAECASVAAGLRDRGVSAGDRVIVHLENCPEFLFAWFACAALKVVVATTNARSTEDEVAYFVEQIQPVAVITQPKFVDLVARAVKDADAPTPLWLAAIADDPIADPHGVPPTASTVPFAEIRGDASSLPEQVADPAALISVQFTSGSTARPKGVLWTHANALWGARVNASHMELRPDDIQYVYMPLFHTNAMAYSVLATLWRGSSFVLLPKWSTSRFWDIAVEERCTWMSLMGISARHLVASEPPPDHAFRAFGFAATSSLVAQKYHAMYVSWWGMTETITHGILGDQQLVEDGVIGRAVPEYDLKVVRPDGRPVVPGETGELRIRGVPGLSLFVTYWNDPRAYDEAHDEEGYFRTGDLVRPNADGTITYIDRLKDMLKVGSENVATLEIERAMMTVPGIAEMAVVGRPDDKLDQVPVAFVVPADPSDLTLGDRLLAACRELLADFKVPREVFLVAALPHSTINKVNKAALRRFIAQPEPDLARAESEWQAAFESDPSGDESPGA